MVEDDLGLRVGAGEVGKIGELGMVKPGLEGEVERRQPRKAGAPGRVEHLPLDRIGARLGERVDQRMLHFFRAAAGVSVGGETALGAGMGHAGSEIAKMAAQAGRPAVKRERDAAIRAHLDVAALRARQR